MDGALKVQRQSFEAVRFTQPARMVPNVLLELELQKALNRYQSMVQQHASSARNGSRYFDNTQEIRRTFDESAASMEQVLQSDSDFSFPELSRQTYANGSAQNLELSTAYTIERAATELRSITGKLTFVPPLTLTIITQYPELHFEYIGDEAEPVSASA